MASSIRLQVQGVKVALGVRALRGHERLGEAARLDLELFAPEPVAIADVIDKPASIAIDAGFGARVINGTVTRFVAIATAQTAPGRRYRATVESSLSLLRFRRRTFVFQQLAVPDIVKLVFQAAAFPDAAIALELAEAHPPREYVTQYFETDEAFIRRICEEEGIYFRFDEADAGDVLVLCDASPHAPAALGDALAVVDRSGQHNDAPAAWDCEALRVARTGKVTVRDYSPAQPAAKLEGTKSLGLANEQAFEVYAAPGGFDVASAGAGRAQHLLEAIRADAATLRFMTTATALAPGRSVELHQSDGFTGIANPEGKYFVTEVSHAWRFGEPVEMRVTAIPLDAPYRLAHTSPKPRIAGIQPARVTGAPGEEIRADAAGQCKIHFFWDREGKLDDKSSLPVRVLQPNLAGSMHLPRVGWEVAVAFDGGDPDRPVVLGRAFNAKQLPPVGLPANKTMTSVMTASSPGGKSSSGFTYDDAAGRQHMVWRAAFDRLITAANDMLQRALGNVSQWIGANQHRTIGAGETIGVIDAFATEAASQRATVTAMQTISTQKMMASKLSSESVLVGGAQLEFVGNPVKGLVNCLAGVPGTLTQFFPISRFGPFTNFVANTVAPALVKTGFGAGATVINNLIDGKSAGAGVVDGLKTSAIKETIGAATANVGGADAVFAALEGGELAPWNAGDHWWQKLAPKPAKPEGGGGAQGSGGEGTGPAQAGPGFRVVKVSGASVELIGGLYTVITPGAAKWTTLGASLIFVGGSHTSKAIKVDHINAGLSTEKHGSLTITTKSGDVTREAKAITTNVKGAYVSKAGKSFRIKAEGGLHLDVGGDLKLHGGFVAFVVGGSKVVINSGGVTLISDKVELPKKATQEGKATND